MVQAQRGVKDRKWRTLGYKEGRRKEKSWGEMKVESFLLLRQQQNDIFEEQFSASRDTGKGEHTRDVVTHGILERAQLHPN